MIVDQLEPFLLFLPCKVGFCLRILFGGQYLPFLMNEQVPFLIKRFPMNKKNFKVLNEKKIPRKSFLSMSTMSISSLSFVYSLYVSKKSIILLSLAILRDKFELILLY